MFCTKSTSSVYKSLTVGPLLVFYQNPEAMTVTCLHAFSRAWRQLQVFDTSSDWFIGLCTSVLISQSYSFVI